MAEECSNAGSVVPRAMVGAYSIMGTGSFITLCVYCACFVDYSVLEAPYPFLQVFVTSTGSVNGAVALASIMIICIFLSVLNFMAATSRQIFAFARDDGFPFRHWIAKVNHKSGSPQNALVVVFLFVIIITLIVLGSSVAFQAIISLGVLALAFTYELSILCLIWRRLYGAPLPPYAWSLGRAGMTVNIAGSVYGFYLMFFAVIPPEYPVTAANFNWSPVMFTAVMGFAAVYYMLFARKVYQGPVVVCQPMYT
jgi:choline transport protein